MRNTHRSATQAAIFTRRILTLLAIFALLTVASAGTLSAQQTFIASALDLPNAPGFQTPQEAQQAQPGSNTLPAAITGTVTDIRGSLVQGATIKLARKAQAVSREAISDADGQFTFPNLPPGMYTVVISSPGLETFQSPIILLRAGDKYELPAIALPVASNTTTVDVVVTQTQVADEELKLETSQRVLAIFPNFYTSFLWNAAPLNTQQKFKLSFHATTDPVAFLTAGIVAGIEQANNTFPDYHQGAKGYARRYGAAYGDAFIGRTLGSAIFPSIFRQDPRYFYMGPASSTRARVKHALLAGLIARGDNGRWQPNYSHIAGNAAAGALSTTYHPDSNSAGQLALDNALIGIGGGAFQGLIREFLWSHLTSKVPSYAKGKPAAATNP